MTARRPPGDDPTPSAVELLTARATAHLGNDALSDVETAAIEDLLAADPAARAELRELEQLVATVRASAPRPHREPDWDDMARAIAKACDETDAARPIRGAVVPLRARRVLFATGFALAAAAAVAVIWTTTRARAPSDTAEVDGAIATDLGALATADVELPVDLGAPELDALADLELELLAEGLDDAPLADLDAALGLDDDPDDAFVFSEPDIDAWLEPLSEEDLQLLDDALVVPG